MFRLSSNFLKYSLRSHYFYSSFKFYSNEIPLSSINKKLIHYKKTKQFDLAEKEFSELKDSKVKLLDNKSISIMIDIYGLNKNYDKAFDLFYSLQRDYNIKIDIDICNSLMGVCAITGHIEKSNLILEYMKDLNIDPNLTTFHKMIQVSIIGNNIQVAEKLLSVIKSFGLEPNVITYNLLMKGNFKFKNNKRGYQLYEELKKHNIPNADTYSILIEHSSSKDALIYLSEMKKYNLQPNINVYNSFIATCGRENENQRVFQIYDIMKQNKIKPNLRTYNSLMASTVAAQNYDKTLLFYKEMQVNNIQPNITTYNTLITRSCRIKDMDTVQELYTELLDKDMTPNIITFNLMIEGFINIEDYETAYEILENMKKIPINHNEKTNRLASKIEEYINNIEETDNNSESDGDVETDNDSESDGDVESDNNSESDSDVETDNDSESDGNVESDNIENNILDDSTIQKITKDTLNLKKDEIEKLKKVSAEKDSINESEVNNMLITLCEACGLENKKEYISIHKDTGAFDESTSEKQKEEIIEVYMRLISVLANLTEFEKIRNVYDAMQKLNIPLTLEVLNLFVMACGQCEVLDKSEMFLDKMEELEIEPDIETYNALLYGYIVINDFDAAVEFLDIIKEDGELLPNSTTFVYIFKCLLEESANEDKEFRKPAAKIVLSKLLDLHIQWDSELYNLVVGIYFQLQDYDKAIETYNTIKKLNHPLKVDAVGSILNIAATTQNQELLTQIANDVDNMEESETKKVLVILCRTFKEPYSESLEEEITKELEKSSKFPGELCNPNIIKKE